MCDKLIAAVVMGVCDITCELTIHSTVTFNHISLYARVFGKTPWSTAEGTCVSVSRCCSFVVTIIEHCPMQCSMESLQKPLDIMINE